MKKNIQEEREKEYISLCKRRDEIREIKRKLPWRLLDVPIQDGWTINMVLIDEVLRRSDGERMAIALNMVNKEFVIRKGQGGKVSNIRKNANLPKIRQFFTYTDYLGRRYYNGPELATLKEDTFKKLHEGVQKYFSRRERVTTSRWGGQKHTTVTYELNIPEYYIGIRVKKRMLTMVQDIDKELLREEAWVDDKLQPFYLFGRGVNSHRSRWYDFTNRLQRKHTKDAIKHLQKGELEEVNNYKKLNKHKL